ncbi:MAG: hypothetical protein C5B48_13125 [Candidatus Rokuibacteriota bacterium]|nr:MAG: hypothetical protein C5B48_13125 [Candidatus Rokubacteria bacterium]
MIAGGFRAVLVSLLIVAVSVATAAEPGLLVTVGEVTDRDAVLWMRGQSPGPLSVRYGAVDGNLGKPIEVQASADRDLTAKLRVQGLAPASRYRYSLSQGAAEASGEFVTAPAASSATPVRFIWSGDLGSKTACRHITDGYPIFKVLARLKADFFLFVGDTIYADHACGGPDRVPGYDFVARTLPEYRAKHRYNREDAGVQAYFRSLSVYGIWDDHEVKNDFSGPSEPLMAVGRQAFVDYFPVQPPDDAPGQLYRKFRWGSLLELFILDARQYRSPNTAPDGPGKTMLGAAQKQWLIDAVSGSTAVWKVIVSSVPLSVPTGGKVHDSWSNANVLGFPEEHGTGFAVERDAILRAFRDRRVKRVVFVAADVHHAELIRHQPTPEWSVHEFIAGPLSAALGRPRPLDMGLNPTTLFALGNVENFGEVFIDQAGFTVRIVDISGAVRFTHTIGPDS